MSEERTLSSSLRTALKDCDSFVIYLWKPAAMAKLCERGLVERMPHHDRAGQKAWRVTPAGREALRNGQ